MRRLMLIAVVEAIGLIALPTVCAFSQEPRPGAPAPAQNEIAPGQRGAQVPAPGAPGASDARGVELLAALLGSGAANIEPAELAGMAAGGKLAVLTLEQAYSLTLIRARNPAGLREVRRANLFDPMALEDEAKRAGVLDFDRFRREFLSTEFRDPAHGFLAALKHRQAVDSARDQVTLTHNMLTLFGEIIRGEASGVSQSQIAQVDHHLLLSRQGRDLEMSSYRSAVDELKVSLGLPPSVPIVLDERILQPFVKAFSSIDAWQRDPRQQLGLLAALHHRLPPLNDLTIGGRSVAQVASGTIPEAEFLRACIEAASKERTILKDEQAADDQRDARELRIRKMARGLILTHKNYEVQRSGLELALRDVTQRFDQLIYGPPVATSALAQSVNATFQSVGVLQAQNRLYRGRADLVSQWLQFKEQSLELYRELGILPYDNWEAFYRSFLPESGADRTAP
jgi:hypothetical protein